MKIFLNQKQVQEVPIIIWRDKSRIFSYLWGIHYTDDHAEGVYRTVLSAWRTPGRFYIEVPNYLFILMPYWPFIYKEKSKGLQIGNE